MSITELYSRFLSYPWILISKLQKWSIYAKKSLIQVILGRICSISMKICLKSGFKLQFYGVKKEFVFVFVCSPDLHYRRQLLEDSFFLFLSDHNRMHAADVLHGVYYLTSQPIPGFEMQMSDPETPCASGKPKNSSFNTPTNVYVLVML